MDGHAYLSLSFVFFFFWRRLCALRRTSAGNKNRARDGDAVRHVREGWQGVHERPPERGARNASEGRQRGNWRLCDILKAPSRPSVLLDAPVDFAELRAGLLTRVVFSSLASMLVTRSPSCAVLVTEFLPMTQKETRVFAAFFRSLAKRSERPRGSVVASLISLALALA